MASIVSRISRNHRQSTRTSVEADPSWRHIQSTPKPVDANRETSRASLARHRTTKGSKYHWTSSTLEQRTSTVLPGPCHDCPAIRLTLLNLAKNFPATPCNAQYMSQHQIGSLTQRHQYMGLFAAFSHSSTSTHPASSSSLPDSPVQAPFACCYHLQQFLPALGHRHYSRTSSSCPSWPGS